MFARASRSRGRHPETGRRPLRRIAVSAFLLACAAQLACSAPAGKVDGNDDGGGQVVADRDAGDGATDGGGEEVVGESDAGTGGNDGGGGPVPCDGGTVQSGSTCVPDPQTYLNTYYLAIGGSDTSPGTSAAPWATFEYAWTKLKPGDLLLVRDGTYKQSMVPKMSGEAGAPITIRAEHRGLAIVTPSDAAFGDGVDDEQDVAINVFSYQGSAPRLIHHLVFDGFIARGRGEHAAVSVSSSDLCDQESEMTHDIVVRNTGAFGSATASNTVVINLGNNLRDTLIEDVFAYGSGRKALQVFGSIRITVRRAVVRYDFWTGDAYKPNDPRVSFSGYNTHDSIFENIIALDAAPIRGSEAADRAGIVASGNATSVTSISGSRNNKYLGVISLDNPGNGFEISGGSGGPNVGISFENIVAWGNTGAGLNNQGNDQGSQISFATFANSGWMGFRLNPYPSAPITDTVVRNTVSSNNGSSGYSYGVNQVAQFTDNSATGNAGASSLGGVSQTNIEASFLPAFTCLVAPTQVAGKQRGATIVNRYVDGVLTTTPLWPWPNEDLIRQHMCNPTDLASPGVDRGLGDPAKAPRWCASGKTLTRYLWEYLGGTTPAGIYGP